MSCTQYGVKKKNRGKIIIASLVRYGKKWKRSEGTPKGRCKFGLIL
jgi:hypothetical protein